MQVKSTIVVSLDDSTVHALYSDLDPEEVVEELKAGIFIACDSDFGRVWIAPSTVRYVQEGKKRLPVSAAPGSNSQSEHRAYVSPTMG